MEKEEEEEEEEEEKQEEDSSHTCRLVTAQTMSFRYQLACKGHGTEKAQDLVT